MSRPTTIILPGCIAFLERFLRPLAATAGDGIEIRQDDHGTTVTACEGRHAATIATRTAGHLEPVLVDPAALAGVDPSRPAKFYCVAETSGIVELGTGELATVTITPGTLPSSARDMADVVGGEIASGMTKAVFEIDPRHLLAVAESLVATGAEKATVAVAPRWNVLAAMVETPEIAATFLVAGETFEVAPPVAVAVDVQAEDDPLTFTIGGRAMRTSSSSRCRSDEPDEPLGSLPF
jgi:hypothetical protein